MIGSAVDPTAEVIRLLDRLVSTLENVSQSIDRTADRQRIIVDVSRVLYHGQLTSSYVKIYTAPQKTSVVVKELIVANTSTSDVSFSFQVVPAPVPPAVAAAGNEHLQYSDVLLRGKETVEASRSLALDANWSIWMKASQPGLVNVHISGVELVAS